VIGQATSGQGAGNPGQESENVWKGGRAPVCRWRSLYGAGRISTRIHYTLPAARPQALESAALPGPAIPRCTASSLASRQRPGALYLRHFRPLATPTWDGCRLTEDPCQERKGEAPGSVVLRIPVVVQVPVSCRKTPAPGRPRFKLTVRRCILGFRAREETRFCVRVLLAMQPEPGSILQGLYHSLLEDFFDRAHVSIYRLRPPQDRPRGSQGRHGASPGEPIFVAGLGGNGSSRRLQSRKCLESLHKIYQIPW